MAKTESVTIGVDIGAAPPKLGVPFILGWADTEHVFIPTNFLSLDWKLYEGTPDYPPIKQIMVTMDGVKYTKEEYDRMWKKGVECKACEGGLVYVGNDEQNEPIYEPCSCGGLYERNDSHGEAATPLRQE